jgi:hypothetical protein
MHMQADTKLSFDKAMAKVEELLQRKLAHLSGGLVITARACPLG